MGSDPNLEMGSDPNFSEHDFARLRWRCRRGMRELDWILDRFVAGHYEALSAAEKSTFAEFLELPDPDLHAYLVGRAEPTDSRLVRLLQRILATLPA